MKLKELLPILFFLGLAHFCIAEEQISSSMPNGFVNVDEMRRALGLSLGASRVYTKEHGFSYGGYVETIFQDYSNSAHWIVTNLHPVAEDLPTNKTSEFTLTRGVLFMGYRWSDRVVFNSEVRLDKDGLERGLATFPDLYDTTHTSTEFSVDLAYVDYMKSPALTFRGGIILVPMGLINEFHNPTEYLGTRSGYGDIYTVSSIWHALGFGFAGRKGPFNYRGYIVSGLNASRFTEMGWRGGREITSDTIKHPGLVGRIEWNPTALGTLGGSYYLGHASVSGLQTNNDQTFRTDLMEFHGEFRWKGAFARAQYAKGLLEKSPRLNFLLQTEGLNGVGKRIVGGYVEGGWNFWWEKENGTMIMPFMRGEAANSQDALPPESLMLGLIKNHFVDFIIWTYGVEVRPIKPLSIKVEYVAPHDQNQIFWKEYHIGASYSF